MIDLICLVTLRLWTLSNCHARAANSGRGKMSVCVRDGGRTSTDRRAPPPPSSSQGELSSRGDSTSASSGTNQHGLSNQQQTHQQQQSTNAASGLGAEKTASEYCSGVINSCQVCGGFYADKSSASPMCRVCHSFLYPLSGSGPGAACTLARATRSWPDASLAKSDSDDSGTEEPKDFYETLRPPPNKLPARHHHQGGTQGYGAGLHQQHPRLPGEVVEALCASSVDVSGSGRGQPSAYGCCGVNPHFVASAGNFCGSDELNQVLQALTHARPAGDRLTDGLVENLPEDVLIAIFSYLDDVALWSASRVCQRWNDILDRQLPDMRWRKFTLSRWPFVGSLLRTAPRAGWRQLFSRLLLSSNCLLCLSQSADRLSHARAHYDLHQQKAAAVGQPHCAAVACLNTFTAGTPACGGGSAGSLVAPSLRFSGLGSISSAGANSGVQQLPTVSGSSAGRGSQHNHQPNTRANHLLLQQPHHQQPAAAAAVYEQPDMSYICRDSRINHEMALLAADPLEGVQLRPVDHMAYGEWHACIAGPVGSPYEGGLFQLTVSVSCCYPMEPPMVRFVTKIFHPNVSLHGDIGLDSLQHNWSLALTLPKILLSIQSLLTDPYTRVCMQPAIGQMYRDNYALYERTARRWTSRYAKHHLSSDVG